MPITSRAQGPGKGMQCGGESRSEGSWAAVNPAERMRSSLQLLTRLPKMGRGPAPAARQAQEGFEPASLL